MKPCPFCGRVNLRVEVWRVRDHYEHAVVCQNCGAQGPTDLGESGAIEMWDMRRPEDALLRQRDELAAALQSIEWVEPPWPAIGHQPFCPWCGNYKSDGHRDDCGRQIALEPLDKSA